MVHDRLISMQLVALAPATARRIDVGKAKDDHPWPQRRINALLVAEARRGRRVVRLKGGDPFVFGRGAEECRALLAAGIPFEIVPGVSSAVGALAYAGIPLTHRDLASGFTVVTGHRRDTASDALEDWAWLAQAETLVVLMGFSRLAEIARQLVEHGRSSDTPVAVVSRATTAEQRVVRGTLGDIAARAAGLASPATIVIGDVAALGDSLDWFDPAAGARVFDLEEDQDHNLEQPDRRSRMGG